jgi:uncharacterized protein
MGFKLSRYHVVTDRFRDMRDGLDKRLLFSTRTAQYRVVGEREWRAIEQGRFDGLPQFVVEDLVRSEFLAPAEENELATILGRNRAAAEDSRSLYQVVQPTAACQMGCGYCSQIHRARALSPEHQDQFLQRVEARLRVGRFERLKIGWFGAEPLLGLAVMRRMSPKLRELAELHDCEYEAKIVTNGLLLDADVSTELVESHCVRSIEVTIDGPAEFHDRSRPLKGGQATQRRVFDNFVALAARDDLDVRLSLRCNVGRANADGVDELLRSIAEAGVQARIHFYAAPIHAWGNDADQQGLTPDEFAAREVGWMALAAELGFPVAVLPERAEILCLATMPQGELVDANGGLFQCTEVSYLAAYGPDHEYARGRLESPAALDGTERAHAWSREVESGATPCAQCPMLPVCGGGCPKLWREGHEPCPSAKRNIRLRLLLAHALERKRATTRTEPAARA